MLFSLHAYISISMFILFRYIKVFPKIIVGLRNLEGSFVMDERAVFLVAL